MGTTSTALETQQGLRYALVLCIEGYEYLVTDGDTGAAVTAWSATDWSNALPGLMVSGTFEQSLTPWSNDLDVPSLRFIVRPDPDDTFGTSVFKATPSARTRLTGPFSTTVTSLPIQDGANFPTSGVAYCGPSRLNYDNKPDSTTLTLSTQAFSLSTFGAETLPNNSFARAQSLGGIDEKQARPMVVTNEPVDWVGKWVGLWMHRIQGSTWDTKAQAKLLFAGLVTDTSDDGINTIIDAEDVRARVRDAILLDDQYHGRVKEGIHLYAGHTFTVQEDLISGSSVGTSHPGTDLTVVSGTPASANEIQEGYHTLSDFVGLVNKWLAHQGPDDLANLNAKWSLSVGAPTSETQGTRTVVTAMFSSSALYRIHFGSSHEPYMAFLGFSGSKPAGGYFWQTASDQTSSLTIASQNPPYRAKPFQPGNGPQYSISLDVEGSKGTWFDNTDYLPAGAKQHTASGENWGYVTIGDVAHVLVKRSSADTYTAAVLDKRAGPLTQRLGPGAALANVGLTVDDDGELTVKQVVILEESLQNLIPRLFMSTDGNAVNHSTYDVFPWGAAIPWEILGTNFVNSVKSLEQTGHNGAVTIVLEKPTRLQDVIIPEMALRYAWLLWKDETLQFISPTEPNATTADHTLDESNKAKPAGDHQDLRSTSAVTTEYMRNVLKVQFNRDISDGSYTRTELIEDEPSVDAHGAKTVTIKARNSYAGHTSNGADILEMMSDLAARMMPVFGRPMRKATRTINYNLFHSVPGDTVALSDNAIRNPVNGTRGLSDRACIVIAQRHSYGNEHEPILGEVDLLFVEEDRTFPLSPTAEVDDTAANAGYDSSTQTITFKSNEHTESGGSTVDLDSFSSGDAVRIIERDPASSTSAQSWTTTISSVNTSTNTVVVADALTGWDTTGATLYRMVSDNYTSATDAQKLQAYQAADTGLISSSETANLYGQQHQLGYSTDSATKLPEYNANEQYGDGAPLSSGVAKMLARNVNNMISYRTAPQMGTIFESLLGSYVSIGSLTAYTVVAVIPWYVGPGEYPSGKTRYLHIAPILKADSTGNIRVTSSLAPPRGSYESVSFVGPYRSHTFTTASTAWEIATAALVEPVYDFGTGLTYLTIEGKSTGSSPDAVYTRGLAECWLGPLS